MTTNLTTIKVGVSRETMENIFVTALEGGCNYWYYLSKEAVTRVRSAVPKSEEECLSVAIFKAVYDHDVEVPINDIENPSEVLGILNKSEMPLRIHKMIEDGHGDAIFSEIREEGDAETSDIIFQYLVMNEIVFG
jgi:hypothetical protein